MCVNGRTVICNGEIYNYESIAEINGVVLNTGSDCEILGYIDENNINILDGTLPL